MVAVQGTMGEGAGPLSRTVAWLMWTLPANESLPLAEHTYYAQVLLGVTSHVVNI